MAPVMMDAGCRSGSSCGTMMPSGARGGCGGGGSHGGVLCAAGSAGARAEKALLEGAAGTGGGGAAGCEGGAGGATSTAAEHVFFGSSGKVVVFRRGQSVDGGWRGEETGACGDGESFLVEEGFEFRAREGVEVVEVVF